MSKNCAPGMWRFQKFGLGIALGGRQMPRGIDDGDIGRGEMLGEPGG